MIKRNVIADVKLNKCKCGSDVTMYTVGDLEGGCFIECNSCNFKSQYSYVGAGIRKWNNGEHLLDYDMG